MFKKCYIFLSPTTSLGGGRNNNVVGIVVWFHIPALLITSAVTIRLVLGSNKCRDTTNSSSSVG